RGPAQEADPGRRARVPAARPGGPLSAPRRRAGGRRAEGVISLRAGAAGIIRGPNQTASRERQRPEVVVLRSLTLPARLRGTASKAAPAVRGTCPRPGCGGGDAWLTRDPGRRPRALPRPRRPPRRTRACVSC